MKLVLYEAMLCVLVFVFGTCIFSFLNVVIYRVPRHQSFVKGFSVCPSCGHRLKAGDLIPVFSYLFLRGKCRYCKADIGARDTMVEMLGGVLALLCMFYYGEDCGSVLTVFAFFSVLTVVTFLDIDTMEIENGCCIAAAALAVISIFTMPGITIMQRLIGMICVSVPMLLLAILISGAFGGGDIKLMAACGLFLGWKLTVVSAALAVLLGGIYGIYLLISKKKGRKDQFAFGPFLCAGMLLAQLYGNQLVHWYLGLMVA